METAICPTHPNRMASWVGDMYVCPACSNGEPPDIIEKEEIEETEGGVVEC